MGGKARAKCYIINNRTGARLTLQFNPTAMTHSRGAKYTSIESAGMSYPLTQFVGGGVRESSFDAFFYDKPFSGVITNARNFLGKLLPPEYNANVGVPPTFTLAYGYFVRTYVLTNLTISEDWLDSDGNPIMATFTLTVRQVGV